MFNSSAAASASNETNAEDAIPMSIDIDMAREAPMISSAEAARAVGRTVFGATLLTGTAVLVARLLTMRVPGAFETIALTWLAAIALGLAAKRLAKNSAPQVRDPVRRFDASFALPAAGIALVLPLTIHVVVASAIGVTARDFDDWARVSVAITGFAHITFALLAAIRANQLATERIAIGSWRIYFLTVFVSCIPFGVLFMIPPLVVGVTGLAIVPMLERMPRWIARDRTVDVPTAVARRAAHV
jgi:hypothetical protein